MISNLISRDTDTKGVTMRIIGAVHMLGEGSLGVLASEYANTDNLTLVIFCPTNLSPSKEVSLLFGRETIEAFFQKATWVRPITQSDAMTLRVLALDEATRKVYLTTKEMPHELRQQQHRMISPSEIPRGAVLSPWADHYAHFAHVASRMVGSGGIAPSANHATLTLPVDPKTDLVALLMRFGFNDGLRDMLIQGTAQADPLVARQQFEKMFELRRRVNRINWNKQTA